MGRGLGSTLGLVGLLIVAAIVGYLMFGSTGEPGEPSMIEGQLRAQDAAKITIYETEVQNAIRNYVSMNGENPESLEDLELHREPPRGMEWDYDPETAIAKMVKSE